MTQPASSNRHPRPVPGPGSVIQVKTHSLVHVEQRLSIKRSNERSGIHRPERSTADARLEPALLPAALFTSSFAVAFDGDDNEFCSFRNIVAQVVSAAEDDDGHAFVLAKLLHHQILTFLDVSL